MTKMRFLFPQPNAPERKGPGEISFMSHLYSYMFQVVAEPDANRAGDAVSTADPLAEVVAGIHVEAEASWNVASSDVPALEATL